MKIFLAASKHNYQKIPPIKEQLEKAGHELTLPNSYNEPMKEEEMKILSQEDHIKWKSGMMKKDKENISPQDAILILNFEKHSQPNYIGGATFLEIYTAWEMNKKIFLMNPIPEGMLKDELIGMNPTVINGDLSKII